MKNKWTRTLILLLITLLLLSQTGCGRDDEALHKLGLIAFIMFLLLSLLSYVSHIVHNYKWFGIIRNRIRVYLLPVSLVGSLVGVALGLYGFFQEGLDELYRFIGLMVASMFLFLGKWCRAEELDKQKLYMRLASLSFTASFVLYYLVRGAPGL